MKSFKNTSSLLGVLAVALLVGCSGERTPELAEVEGTLTLKGGGPLANVRVMFLPDPEEEVFGQPSSATTDANGKFVLHYDGNESKPGAAIGWNRVMLTDILAIRSSRDENPTPRRFALKYTVAGTTDLKFEIKSGEKQTIDVEVDPPRR